MVIRRADRARRIIEETLHIWNQMFLILNYFQ